MQNEPRDPVKCVARRPITIDFSPIEIQIFRILFLSFPAVSHVRQPSVSSGGSYTLLFYC